MELNLEEILAIVRKNQPISVSRLKDYEVGLILLLGSRGHTSAIDGNKIYERWKTRGMNYIDSVVENLTEGVRGMRYKEIEYGLDIRYQAVGILVNKLGPKTGYTLQLNNISSRDIRKSKTKFKEVVLTKTGTEMYEGLKTKINSEIEDDISQSENNLKYVPQGSLGQSVMNVLNMMEGVQQEFGDKPEYEHHRYAISRIIDSLGNIVSYERVETKKWEQKEYQGIPKSHAAKNHATFVVKFLADEFGNNGFTITEANSLNIQFMDQYPRTLSSRPISTLENSINNLYNGGLLEHDGLQSYRLVHRAFQDLGIDPTAAK